MKKLTTTGLIMMPQPNARLVAAAFVLCALPSQGALTAYWNFEGNATDQISSNAGTLAGAAATNGAAIAPTGSNSLSLPSAGSYLETNTNGGLGGTSSFTIFTTIQTNTTVDATIFNYSPTVGTTGGADLRLFVQANGDLRVEMSQGAGFNLSDTWDLGDGAAHSVAVVFNSTTGNSFQDLDLYVDGTLYDVTGGTDHTINLGAGEIFIGRDQASVTSRPFVGLIDDFAIYDEGLSLSALDDLRINGISIPEPSALLLGSLGFVMLLRRRR